MKRLLGFLLCVILTTNLSPQIVKAEVLEPGILAILEPVWNVPYQALSADVAWGDYDNDGDLDLAMGNSGTKNWVFRNDGKGVFARVWESDEADDTRSVAWGDWDDDGCLDLAVGNYGAGGQANRVYRNVWDAGQCTGLQTSPAWSSSETFQTTSVAWGNWDGDGDLDLAVGNFGNANQVYGNEGGFFSSPTWTAPWGEGTQSVAWGDWDGDGVLELAVGNNGLNRVYENDGDGSSDSLSPGWLSDVSDDTWSVAWGDWDGNGSLDLAVGNANSPIGEANYVYLNDGGVPPLPTSPTWTSNETDVTYVVAWGDWDGDGDVDLAVGNGPSNGPDNAANRVYRNDPGTLTLMWTASEESDRTLGAAWGDADGDGDLDMLFANDSTSGNMPSRLYGNTKGALTASDVGWDTSPIERTYAVAWGDWDRDGDLDLAVGNAGPNYVFQNDGGVLSLAWASAESDDTRSVAWGDWDGDRDLDLAVANYGSSVAQANRVYENDDGTLALAWTSDDMAQTTSVTWVDWDRDQDLDLFATNTDSQGAPNVLYENTGGNLTPGPIWVSSESETSQAAAWGDWDDDGDLDLAVANSTDQNRIYENDGGDLASVLDFGATDASWSLAWGDYDQDGDLDLAVGNYNQPNQLYKNISDTLILDLVTTEAANTQAVSWGDLDGDGDLDLAVANTGTQANHVYLNVQGTLLADAMWSSQQFEDTRDVAWGDVDGDGDFDLLAGNYDQPNRLYTNALLSPAALPNNPTYVYLDRPGASGEAAYFSVEEILVKDHVTVSYTLYDSESDEVGWIEPQVSWNGGGQWLPATAAGGDGTINLATSPAGTAHVLIWDAMNDMIRDGYLSQAYQESLQDDVAFRITTYSQPQHAGVIQRPHLGSETYLFRLDIHPDWLDSYKTVTPTLPIAGEFVTYTLVFTNSDLGQPPGMITDVLPAEVYLAGMPWASHPSLQYSYDANAITWTEAITYNTPVTIEFQAQVHRPLTDGTILENCAWLWDGLHPAFWRCITFTVVSTPTLTESWKQVSDLVASPGDPLTYTIVLTNTGTDNAHGAIMTDTLPANVLWADYLTATGGAASYANGTVTWQGDVNVFEPVSVTYRVTIAAPLPGGSLITNTAWAWDGITPPFWITPPVTTTALAPNLARSVKVPSAALVELGDVLTYTIVLSNDGGLDANPVALVDAIPQHTSYISQSFEFSDGFGRYVPVSDTITWTGAVSVEMPVTLTFAVTVSHPPSPTKPIITNTVQAEDPMGGPVTLLATTTVRLPDLSGSYKVVSPSLVELGDRLTYTIVISNAAGFAPLVEMEDPIPQGGAYVADSFWVSGGQGGYDAGSDTITWTGAVSVETPVTLTFAITAEGPSDPTWPGITNTAQVEDPTGQVVTLLATTTIWLPDLFGSSKVVSPSLVELGDRLTYTIVISNAEGFAPQVEMEDPIPPGSTYVPGSFQSSNGEGGYDAGSETIVWTGDMDTDMLVTVTFAITAGCPSNTETGTIVNTATMRDSADQSWFRTAVANIWLPDLSTSTKEGSPVEVINGDLLAYTVSVVNSGGYAPDVYVSDPLPVHVDWLDQYSVTQGTVSYLPASHQVQWQVGALDSGGGATLEFDVLVDLVGITYEITNVVELGDSCTWLTMTATTPIQHYRFYLPIVARQH